MRRVSMATRDELVAAVAQRYREADRADKSKILDEFSAVTGFHRKHAMRLLRSGFPSRAPSRERLQRRLTPRLCGKRCSFCGRHPTGFAASG